MITLSEIKKSFFVSLWFVFLTFPIMVIRVNSTEKTVEWRWRNMLLVAIASFILSFLWRYFLKRKEVSAKKVDSNILGMGLYRQFLPIRNTVCRLPLFLQLSL